MSERLPLSAPPRLLVEPVLQAALLEDLGLAGDLTTEALIPPDRQARGALITRQAGVVAGLTSAALTFQLLDPAVRIDPRVADGDEVKPHTVLAVVEGPARALLTAERTVLNLLGMLCGIATTTRTVVVAIAGSGAAVAPTRKTTPGLRMLQRYAVRAGGGSDHRFGLGDAVLIKDNHLIASDTIADALRRVRERVGHLVKVEIEVDTLDQLEEVLSVQQAYGVDAVLLDNFSLDDLKEAVAAVRGTVITEASGGISPDTAPAVAATGVDILSLGWLTHSVRSLDVAFDLDASGRAAPFSP